MEDSPTVDGVVRSWHVESGRGEHRLYLPGLVIWSSSRTGRHLEFRNQIDTCSTGSDGEAVEDSLFQQGMRSMVIPSMSSTPIGPGATAKEFSGATQSMVDLFPARRSSIVDDSEISSSNLWHLT